MQAQGGGSPSSSPANRAQHQEGSITTRNFQCDGPVVTIQLTGFLSLSPASGCWQSMGTLKHMHYSRFRELRKASSTVCSVEDHSDSVMYCCSDRDRLFCNPPNSKQSGK
jgi:Fe-S cluster biogenesis protein NfuA